MNPLRILGSLFLLCWVALVASCSARPISPAAIPVYGYRVIATYPHDTQAFTEGLVYDNGFLYEGTGLVGRSSLRKVDLTTGRVLQSRDLPPPYFGEGVTTFGGKIYQLTWQSHVGFVYDKATFGQVGQFSYDTEGWGLTQDGKRLIMSDGTAALYYLDPGSLKVTGQLNVQDVSQVTGPMRLNELEWVNGEIYANVWPTNYIVRIAPRTGRVTGIIDLTSLSVTVAPSQPDAVLNGIAYDAKDRRLFVTGKLWPHLFEIRLVRLK